MQKMQREASFFAAMHLVAALAAGREPFAQRADVRRESSRLRAKRFFGEGHAQEQSVHARFIL